MKRFSFVFILTTLALIPILTHAGWERTYGGEGNDFGYCVQQTNDGGFVITGSKNNDIWLIKTNANGDTLWTRTYGGDHIDVGYCVRQTKDGGYILVGRDHLEHASLLLLKTNALGDTLWKRRYGNNAGGTWVEQTRDGGFIITGYIHFGYYSHYLWLLKTNNSGDTLWTTQIKANGRKTGYCVQQTNDGGYIVAGVYCTFDDNPEDPHDVDATLLVKFDSTGNHEWTKDRYWVRAYDSRIGAAYCVVQASDGGYVVAADSEVQLFKTDSLGNFQWEHTYGTNGIRSVQQAADGGYILIGTQYIENEQYNLCLIKTDVNGNLLWNHSYGGSKHEKGYSVQQTKDGGYIAVGYTESTSAGESDIYLIKTDSLGYVGIEEKSPATHQPDWQVISSIGRTITLRASEASLPLALAVFDASGRQVDAVRCPASPGSITWGDTAPSGVYFIRASGTSPLTRKVILVK